MGEAKFLKTNKVLGLRRINKKKEIASKIDKCILNAWES